MSFLDLLRSSSVNQTPEARPRALATPEARRSAFTSHAGGVSPGTKKPVEKQKARVAKQVGEQRIVQANAPHPQTTDQKLTTFVQKWSDPRRDDRLVNLGPNGILITDSGSRGMTELSNGR